MASEKDITSFRAEIEAARDFAAWSDRRGLDLALDLARRGDKVADRAQAARLLKSLSVPLARTLEQAAPLTARLRAMPPGTAADAAETVGTGRPSLR